MVIPHDAKNSILSSALAEHGFCNSLEKIEQMEHPESNRDWYASGFTRCVRRIGINWEIIHPFCESFMAWTMVLLKNVIGMVEAER